MKISRPQNTGMELNEPLSTIGLGQKRLNTVVFKNCEELKGDGGERSKTTRGLYPFILIMAEAGSQPCRS